MFFDWLIETLFKAFKRTGFESEETHLKEGERIKKLFALMAIAFCWAHLVGEWLNEIKPLKVKNIKGWEKVYLGIGWTI
jgi:hypothetical protein